MAKNIFSEIASALRKEVNANFDKSDIKASPQVSVVHQSGFQLKQKWLSSRSTFHIVNAVFCNLVTWPVAYMLLEQKVYSQSPGVIAFLIFPLLAIFLAYKALGELLNTTTIQIKSGKLLSATGPISLSGPILINTSELKNVLVRRHREGKRGQNPIYSYLLVAHLKNDAEKIILRSKDLNEALYIEKLLEEHLAVIDRPELDQRIN